MNNIIKRTIILFIIKGTIDVGLRNFTLAIMFFSLVMGGGQPNKHLISIDTSKIEEIKYQVEIVQEEVIEENTLNKMDELQDEIETKVDLIKFNLDGLKLKEGVASEEVFRINKFLKEKGYIDIAENYYYDNKIKEIITKYQKENDLIADGIIGKNTYQKINEDIEKNNIIIPEMQMLFTEEVPEGDWIIINKSNNTLYHLKSKEIINKYPVATGKDVKYTPEGKFTIITKYINPAWGGAGRYKPIKGGAPNNPLGKRWMGLNINGGGSYGIHGNSDEGSIGRYASLGCIRMFNKDVEILYDLINKGTAVWIGNETKLKEYGILFDLFFIV